MATSSRMDDSGKLCWTNKPAFSPQQDDPVISPPVVIVPPPPEGGLAGTEPGPKKTSRNVVILVCVLLPKVLLKLCLELNNQHLHCLMEWKLLS